MNRITNYVLIAAIGTLMLACATEAADHKAEPAATDNRLPVDVKVVKHESHQQEESVAGSILANRQVDITSELAKKVSSIHFSDGMHVGKGQLLYKLEDGEIRARLKQAESEFRLAKLTESRLAQLLRNESVRQEEYDAAKTRLESTEASKDLLQIELAKTSIHSPFAGVVGISKVQTGSLVTPGATLVTIQEQETVKIEFTVSEKYLDNIRKGKVIHFSIGGNSARIPATIVAKESFVDVQSRMITVHAKAANRNGKLRPGMSARVFFPTSGEDSRALSLPTEALIPSANGYSVFTVKNGQAKMTAVTLGIRNESQALITSGLADGDTVMISNILRTGDGTPVQIVSAK